MKKIKSPLNYVGGKYKLLNQIFALFPKNINTFVDLFTGGCNVGINMSANRIICNDVCKDLINMYIIFKKLNIDHIIEHIEDRIKKYSLSKTNTSGYYDLRNYYNNHKNPLDLFVIICYSYNNQMRFNRSEKLNMPFGKKSL